MDSTDDNNVLHEYVDKSETIIFQLGTQQVFFI